MNEMLNPAAKLTSIGSAPSTDSMLWTSKVVSKSTLASDAGDPLAHVNHLKVGPMPWEISPREPVAKFKEQDVP
jgi:hypothetical protein